MADIHLYREEPDSNRAANALVPFTPPEPFVEAEIVSAFLSIPRSEILRMTREGRIRGYPYKGRLRHVYRYRLSEVSADFKALASKPERTMRDVAPVSLRRKSNG